MENHDSSSSSNIGDFEDEFIFYDGHLIDMCLDYDIIIRQTWYIYAVQNITELIEHIRQQLINIVVGDFSLLDLPFVVMAGWRARLILNHNLEAWWFRAVDESHIASNNNRYFILENYSSQIFLGIEDEARNVWESRRRNLPHPSPVLQQPPSPPPPSPPPSTLRRTQSAPALLGIREQMRPRVRPRIRQVERVSFQLMEAPSEINVVSSEELQPSTSSGVTGINCSWLRFNINSNDDNDNDDDPDDDDDDNDDYDECVISLPVAEEAEPPSPVQSHHHHRRRLEFDSPSPPRQRRRYHSPSPPPPPPPEERRLVIPDEKSPSRLCDFCQSSSRIQRRVGSPTPSMATTVLLSNVDADGCGADDDDDDDDDDDSTDAGVNDTTVERHHEQFYILQTRYRDNGSEGDDDIVLQNDEQEYADIALDRLLLNEDDLF